MAETIAPDGKPFALPHESVVSGRRYRIVEESVLDFRTGEAHYLIANESGVLFIIRRATFDLAMRYVPGGQ